MPNVNKKLSNKIQAEIAQELLVGDYHRLGELAGIFKDNENEPDVGFMDVYRGALEKKKTTPREANLLMFLAVVERFGPINIRNSRERIQHLDQAIELGHSMAMVYRAKLYESGKEELDRKPNFAKAILLYDRVASDSNKDLSALVIAINSFYLLPKEAKTSRVANEVASLLLKNHPYKLTAMTVSFLKRYCDQNNADFQEIVWRLEMDDALRNLKSFNRTVKDNRSIHSDIRDHVNKLSENLDRHFKDYLCGEINKNGLKEAWTRDIDSAINNNAIRTNMAAKVSWKRVLGSILAILAGPIGWIGLALYNHQSYSHLQPAFFTKNRQEVEIDCLKNVLSRSPTQSASEFSEATPVSHPVEGVPVNDENSIPLEEDDLKQTLMNP